MLFFLIFIFSFLHSSTRELQFPSIEKFCNALLENNVEKVNGLLNGHPWLLDGYLYFAVDSCEKEVIELLVEKGAKLDIAFRSRS